MILSHLVLVVSSITLTVQSTSHEGTWRCLVDVRVDAVKQGDQIAVTLHDPHARMEAAPDSPPPFKEAIAAESPSQQSAISLLDGKTVVFSPADKNVRFSAGVMFAGVDAAWWLAQVWAPGAPRTHATAWGVPWKLTGSVTPGDPLAAKGALEGDLTVNGVKRHVTVTIDRR